MPKSRADSLAVTVITGLRNAAPAAPLEYVVYLQQCPNCQQEDEATRDQLRCTLKVHEERWRTCGASVVGVLVNYISRTPARSNRP